MKNATAAQTLRITRIRKDIKGTGYRITTRQLPAGLIQVTEYLGRTKAAVSVLGTDGNYVTATPAKAAKLATKKTAKPRLVNENVAALVITALIDRMPATLRDKLEGELSAADRATLETGLRLGRELRARAAR